MAEGKQWIRKLLGMRSNVLETTQNFLYPKKERWLGRFEFFLVSLYKELILLMENVSIPHLKGKHEEQSTRRRMRIPLRVSISVFYNNDYTFRSGLLNKLRHGLGRRLRSSVMCSHQELRWQRHTLSHGSREMARERKNKSHKDERSEKKDEETIGRNFQSTNPLYIWDPWCSLRP